jgi:formate dehydrogenase maturation protein FdhE
MSSDKWDPRTRRANELKSVHPYASEILTFYSHVAPFQKTIYEALEIQRGAATTPPLASEWREELDPFLLFPLFGPFLNAIEKYAPAPLSARSRELRTLSPADSQKMLAVFWRAILFSQDACEHRPLRSNPQAKPRVQRWTSYDAGKDTKSEPQQAAILSMFLQPLAEYLADHSVQALPDETPSLCPRCQSKPLVGALRPEGDGAKRSLICSLCATEWSYRRIVCPSCGEEDVHKLAIYSAEGIAHVRVEACETCRHYIKTVDLTKDGRAVPIIDELATIPLNLWAAEHGYTKSATNLVGL